MIAVVVCRAGGDQHPRTAGGAGRRIDQTPYKHKAVQQRADLRRAEPSLLLVLSFARQSCCIHRGVGLFHHCVCPSCRADVVVEGMQVYTPCAGDEISTCNGGVTRPELSRGPLDYEEGKQHPHGEEHPVGAATAAAMEVRVQRLPPTCAP